MIGHDVADPDANESSKQDVLYALLCALPGLRVALMKLVWELEPVLEELAAWSEKERS